MAIDALASRRLSELSDPASAMTAVNASVAVLSGRLYFIHSATAPERSALTPGSGSRVSARARAGAGNTAKQERQHGCAEREHVFGAGAAAFAVRIGGRGFDRLERRRLVVAAGGRDALPEHDARAGHVAVEKIIGADAAMRLV